MGTETRPVYLDYAATTPVDPRVAESMLRYLTQDQDFGNPASMQHAYGRMAHEVVELARAQVARLIGAEAAEIVWTSGATESNNLAIKGVVEAYADRGRHIISMKTEHKSVVDTLRYLEQQGWRISWLAPDATGRLSIGDLRDACRDDTVLISIMLVNNETGVMQDIQSVAEVARERGILLHVDAAQAAGKLPINVNVLPVDLLSLSAHKYYGPKGIGALYVRRKPRVRVTPQLHGGGHERGMRSGTLPVHQIAGMGRASEIAADEMQDEMTRVGQLRDQLWQALSRLPDVFRNGAPEYAAPGILNISVAGVDGEALHAGLSGLQMPIAISSGSACTAASQEASYVLRALGRDDELAYASVRFSLGRWTSQTEIQQVADSVAALIEALRARSPKWSGGSSQAPVSMSSRHALYSEPVWRYFIRGLQAPAAPFAADIEVHCQTPGSRAELELSAVIENGRVQAADFRAYGCVTAIAVAAWLCEWLQDKSLSDISLSARDIEQELSVAAVKRHCTLMAEDALGMLLQKWRQTTELAQQASL